MKHLRHVDLGWMNSNLITTVDDLDMHIDGGEVDRISATPVNWLQGGW
jgi:hypothetical protein